MFDRIRIESHPPTCVRHCEFENASGRPCTINQMWKPFASQQGQHSARSSAKDDHFRIG